MNQEEKLARIIEVLEDGKVSQKDFVDAVEVLVQFVKGAKDLTEKELERIEAVFAEKEYEMNATHKRSLDTLKEKLEEAITARVATIKDGKDGVNGLDGNDGLDGKDGVDGKDGSPDTPLQIVDKLESIQREDDKLSIDAIKGLRAELKKASRSSGGTFFGGAQNVKQAFKDIDLSSQLDGVTKTFNIEAVYNILSVSLSSFPHTLRKGVDYTYTTTTITFTSEIDASVSLATGQTCILTVVGA